MLVSSVDRCRWNSLELCTVFISQFSVFLLLFVKNLLTSSGEVSVQFIEFEGTLNCLEEVLGHALLLEFFDLGPDFVGDCA